MPSPNPDLPFLQSSLGEDFPDGLVVKTLSFHCRGGASVQSLVGEVPHVWWCSQDKTKQKTRAGEENFRSISRTEPGKG